MDIRVYYLFYGIVATFHNIWYDIYQGLYKYNKSNDLLSINDLNKIILIDIKSLNL